MNYKCKCLIQITIQHKSCQELISQLVVAGLLDVGFSIL